MWLGRGAASPKCPGFSHRRCAFPVLLPPRSRAGRCRVIPRQCGVRRFGATPAGPQRKIGGGVGIRTGRGRTGPGTGPRIPVWRRQERRIKACPPRPGGRRPYIAPADHRRQQHVPSPSCHPSPGPIADNRRCQNKPTDQE